MPDSFGTGSELDESAVESLNQMWGSRDVAEPLARQVLLEAQELAVENPRAALVLAVTAAEMGVKQFAARQARESEAWLLNNLASPPLATLLKEHLPFFTEKHTTDGHAVPKRLRRAVAKAVEKRNKVVHRGDDADYDVSSLPQVLADINELLYLLDWFAGHDWAFDHLQPATQRAYER